jgi:hypothetical protein
MDEKQIAEFQRGLLKADEQMRRGKTRLTFIVGVLAGIILCISTRSDGLPIITWFSIPIFMGFVALIFRAILRR